MLLCKTCFRVLSICNGMYAMSVAKWVLLDTGYLENSGYYWVLGTLKIVGTTGYWVPRE